MPPKTRRIPVDTPDDPMGEGADSGTTEPAEQTATADPGLPLRPTIEPPSEPQRDPVENQPTPQALQDLGAGFLRLLQGVGMNLQGISHLPLRTSERQAS